MSTELHGIPEEIRVGDAVETSLGVGRVTAISKLARKGIKPMVQIDLGRKWLDVDQVRSILRHPPEPTERSEPEMHWDEHD
jgi:hypothetical protein